MNIELIRRCLLTRIGAVASARILATASLSILLLAGSVYSQSLPGYHDKQKPKAAEQLSIPERVTRGQAPLRKLYGNLKPDASRMKRLPPLNARNKRNKSEKRLQVGIVRTFASALNPLTDSAKYSIAEGDVRVAEIVSEGARYLRLHFKDFSLPAGARVFVYSAANADLYLGPYEGRGPWNNGTFWTPSLPGDHLVIEYLSPPGTASANTPFEVSEVAHIYKDALTINDSAGDCNLEVTSPWADVAKSVGMLQFVTGGLVAVCTGTLLNDSNPNLDHYVLTANHCISSQAEAQSAQIFWNYNTGDDPPPGTPSSFGPNLMVTGTANDFTLLRFAGVIPGLYYSGWDASPVSSLTSVTGIHHPYASHKRIAFGMTNATCLFTPCENFTGVTWNPNGGTTEPGSSGSGIWTGTPDNAKLVGTLTGGEASCATPTASDYYGRFSVTYQNISAFLSGTNCVTSINPTNQSIAATGDAGSFAVTAPAGCNWTASSTATFLTITSGASGNGNGTVNFSVTANNGLQRSGSIVVGTQVFTVNQAAGGVCAPTPIAIGQTVNGTLSTSDCPLGDGSYLDAYSFNGIAGQRISILMTSSAFDTYLYLLNPDGSILVIDNDGGGGTNSRIPAGSGFLTLPTAGTYTILANSFSPGATGAYSLMLSEQPKQTLSVLSTNPDSGVSITVTPTDTNGLSNGTTTFTRTFYQNTTVVLNAAGIAGGNEFKEWRKDGVVVGTSNVVVFNMDKDHTMTAVYGPITTYTLTVGSSNPNNGVNISASPNDNGGLGNGMTQFMLTYNHNTFVNLIAPATAPGGNIFQKWQRDGVDLTTDQLGQVLMNGNHTMTAVYVVPQTFVLAVNSSNPNSGVNITVSPNDKNNLGDGTTQFVRSYDQSTTVTLTAPAAAGNGNIFDRWLINGSASTFSRSTNAFMSANVTMTAVYLTKPVIFAEEGTNNAAALDSVTFLRGPFQLLDPNNFSVDKRTRIVLFTSDLGLTQSDLSDPAVLVVDVPGYLLPVENVGALAGIPGLSASYIIVRLPDGLPTGDMQLRVRLRGVTSDARTLSIAP
jgi:hypothetical protein